MSRRNWKLFLEDILESVELIKDYTKGMNLDSFKNDRKTIDAVVRNLEMGLSGLSRYLCKFPTINHRK